MIRNGEQNILNQCRILEDLFGILGKHQLGTQIANGWEASPGQILRSSQVSPDPVTRCGHRFEAVDLNGR